MFRIQLLRGDAVYNIGGTYATYAQAVSSAQFLVGMTSIQGGRATGYQIMNECNVVLFQTIA